MFDVIVVGARLAGASTAMLLSRQGRRVLMVERAHLPSKRRAATNVIHPPGVLRLKRWGLLDEVMTDADAPRLTHYGLQAGDAEMIGALPAVGGVDFALAPRRETLDDIVTTAAVAAGAELREGLSVQALLRDGDGAVTGISARDRSGTVVSEYARLVVGADGPNSKVAALVDARKRYDVGVLSKSYFAWWRGDLPRDGVVRTYRHERQHLGMWPTHDDLTLVAIAYPAGHFVQREDAELDANAAAILDRAAPGRAGALRRSRRVGKWLLGSAGNFLRYAQGPGWALVGDAGYCRDPITASGITDALRGAELLAQALEPAFSGGCTQARALADYEQRRNDEVLGHFAYTCDFAAVKDHSREEVALIRAMGRSPRHASGMVGVFSGVIHPAQFYAKGNFEQLFEYTSPRRALGLKLGFVDLLMRGLPGRPQWGRSLAHRLLAANLGSMGPYLLADGTASPPARLGHADPDVSVLVSRT